MTKYNLTLKGDHWMLQIEGSEAQMDCGNNKGRAVKAAADYCKKKATKESPISLKIRNKNGRWREERTYPKSADPKSSKG